MRAECKLHTTCKTVLRAGYGVFYETIIENIPGNVMLNPPFLPDYFNSFPFASWPNAFAPSGFPVLTITQQNLRTPYAQHFNVGIQHQLPGRILFDLAYVGTSFALPANILAAPNLGTLFQTPDAAQNNVGLGSGGPRLIQFALKLSF